MKTLGNYTIDLFNQLRCHMNQQWRTLSSTRHFIPVLTLRTATVRH